MGLNFGIEVAYQPLASEHGLTLLRLRPENPSDGGREPPPVRTLFNKLFSPSLGEGVESGFPVICRSAPSKRHSPLPLQAAGGRARPSRVPRAANLPRFVHCPR